MVSVAFVQTAELGQLLIDRAGRPQCPRDGRDSARMVVDCATEQRDDGNERSLDGRVTSFRRRTDIRRSASHTVEDFQLSFDCRPWRGS
jgi:hypothetical protein